MAPKLVIPVNHLFQDIRIMEAIFEGNTPSELPIRFSKTASVHYGFADASGRGFGSILEEHNVPRIDLRIGLWSAHEEQENSSNWREF